MPGFINNARDAVSAAAFIRRIAYDKTVLCAVFLQPLIGLCIFQRTVLQLAIIVCNVTDQTGLVFAGTGARDNRCRNFRRVPLSDFALKQVILRIIRPVSR